MKFLKEHTFYMMLLYVPSAYAAVLISDAGLLDSILMFPAIWLGFIPVTYFATNP
jgi:hypothetical protein